MKRPASSKTNLSLKDGSLQLFIAAGICVLFVNISFYFTYPINIGQSDNAAYVKMIALGSSHLTFASGYPATIYALSHRLPYSFPLTEPSELNNWFNSVQTIQLLLHLMLFSVSIFLCARVLSKSAAAILALGWGCNVLFVSNVNAAAPEWLQSDVLMLSILMHAYGRKQTAKKKAAGYCVAAAVFAFAYLIKPNSLLFVICPLAFLVFDKANWRFKALQLSCSIAIFLLLVSAYAGSYHYNWTGTTRLNFDHAWVLTAALPSDYLSASPERLGTNSLRWAALSSVTPPDYSKAGLIEKFDFGPPAEVRGQYKERLEGILRMSRDELRQFVKGHPLPPGFSQWSSAIPFYYYYGLDTTDALGVAVYVESLRSHSWYHISKVGNALATFFTHGLNSIQTFPTLVDPIGYKLLPPDFNASIFGKSTIVPPPDTDPFVLQYYNPQRSVLLYGVKVVQVLNMLTSAPFLYLALNIIALLGLFRLKSDLLKIAAFSLLAALLAFVSASGILLGLRQKELITITPVYFLLISIGLINVSRWWVKAPSMKPGALDEASPAFGDGRTHRSRAANHAKTAVRK